MIMDFDNEFKATAIVVAHDVIVSFVGGTIHSQIKEGNASVMISSQDQKGIVV